MAYIQRDMEEKILSLSREYPCLLITGPRQVGKTTVLRQLMTPDRNYVTLDDLEERRLAKEDPALFLQLHDLPLFSTRCSTLRSCSRISRLPLTTAPRRGPSG